MLNYTFHDHSFHVFFNRAILGTQKEQQELIGTDENTNTKIETKDP